MSPDNKCNKPPVCRCHRNRMTLHEAPRRSFTRPPICLNKAVATSHRTRPARLPGFGQSLQGNGARPSMKTKRGPCARRTWNGRSDGRLDLDEGSAHPSAQALCARSSIARESREQTQESGTLLRASRSEHAGVAHRVARFVASADRRRAQPCGADSPGLRNKHRPPLETGLPPTGISFTHALLIGGTMFFDFLYARRAPQILPRLQRFPHELDQAVLCPSQ